MLTVSEMNNMHKWKINGRKHANVSVVSTEWFFF